MTRDIPLENVSPAADRRVTEQLDAWVCALEMAVATLNQTLTEVKEFQTKGGPDGGDDTAAGGESDAGEHGGG